MRRARAYLAKAWVRSRGIDLKDKAGGLKDEE